MRSLGGALANCVERSTWGQGGALRNFHAGEATVIGGVNISAHAGLTVGNLHPASWSLPRKPGGMSSRGYARISIGASGSVSRGLDVAGSASIAINASGTAAAVGSVAGSASISISASGAAYGQATVAGSASVAITASANIGAKASVSGSASITITASSTMGCTARVAGSAYLSAAAEGATLSEAGIAAAVVDALEATTIPVDLQKVRGQALEGAGTEVDPWGPA